MTSTDTTATASAAAIGITLVRRLWGAAGGATLSRDVLTDSTDASNSLADCGLLSGFLSRQRITSAASGWGTSGRRSESDGGVSVTCAVINACIVFRSANGCAPASSSHATTPQA